MKFKIILIILVGCILITRFVFIPAPPLFGSKPPRNSTLEKINQEYLAKVKPIFQKKCLMCHGVVKKVPLYTIIPLVSLLINHHRKEAKEHLNMSFDYPFRGHDDDLLKDLEELKEVIEEGKMPPPSYRLMHWSSTITKKEKEIIFSWMNQASHTLQKEGGLKPQKHHHDHQNDHEHN